MEINWSIVGWIAGLLFVYIFGLFEGRAQGRKRRIAEEQEEKKQQPDPASPPPTPTPVKVDDPGILRIKNMEGKLTLDLDGERVEGTSLTAMQRKRLIEILTTMRPWLEGKPAVAPTPRTPPPKPTSLEERLEKVSTPPHSKPVSSPQSTPISKPVPTPVSSSNNNEEKTAAPTSIVGQINEILQARIANTELESMGVSLMESPSGGVIVYIGLNKYESIDQVPNEAIKGAIRAAIAEWENKYTPGLS